MTAATAAQSTDRVESSIRIDAPRSRVWRALSDAGEFGSWFGANLQGQRFAPGQRVQGPITIQGFEHVVFDVVIEQVEPEHLMSYRWHPHPVDPAVDYSKEQRTLVTFTLRDAGAGTLLTVVETGFDGVPPDRRQEAFRGVSAGWPAQLRNIQRHATTG